MRKSSDKANRFLLDSKVPDKDRFYRTSASAEMASITTNGFCFYHNEKDDSLEMWTSGNLMMFGENKW